VLIAVLGLTAGLIGVGFKTFLYKLEDLADEAWRGRPEWARPAVGGLVLGVVLLALPQMYGVGYPVMDRVLAGREVLWFIVILMLGKILASSVTLSIGGSGGVFAPSLFVGASAGMAFGLIAQHLFGAAIGPPAMYGVVAMGAVFAAAAQAPLTAIASVAEMTSNFTLTLPIMLATAIAAALSKRLSYGSIYTTKLLRRGIDIERPRPTNALQMLTVADVMQPLAQLDGRERLSDSNGAGSERVPPAEERWERLVGPVTDRRQPQALFADEDLEQALRQLVLFGRDGLPVLSHDAQQLRGWITRNDVLSAVAERVDSSTREIEEGALASEFSVDDPESRVHVPNTPLRGYRIVELTVGTDSPAAGRRVDEIRWPAGCRVVAMTEQREIRAAASDARLRAGERVIVLAPLPPEPDR
jgi:CIC family chloride channel protein